MKRRTLLFWFVYCVVLSAASVNEPALPEQIATNYGTMIVINGSITLNGHQHWSGIGKLRDDGKVQILWTELETQRPAISVYTIKEGKMIGTWGYADEVQIVNGGLEVRPGVEDDEWDPVIDSDTIRWGM